MAKPKVCVLRAPGTNCDVETAHAFALCGAAAERVHLFRLLDEPTLLREYQILCIPGGFSYGDDVGAGVIFAAQLRARLADAVHEFLSADKLTLGICNGFQVLLKAGILPGGADEWPPADLRSRPVTLTWNDNGRYTACWVRLRVTSEKSVFLKGIEELELPVAHAEGRLAVRDADTIDGWRERGQIALQYIPQAGQPLVGAASESAVSVGANRAAEDANLSVAEVGPYNPSGSVGDIAGLGDPSGRVLGLMPHPERYLHATQYPRWTSCGLAESGAGLRVFQNGVDYFE